MVSGRGSAALRKGSPRAARERVEACLDRPAGELLATLQADRDALARLLVDVGIMASDLQAREA